MPAYVQGYLPQMGPAEVVASLKELCIESGPRLTTDQITAWIDKHQGFESRDELVAYAKRMKARQYARLLMYEDEESGLKVKRLWSFRDPETGRRYYYDLAKMAPEARRRLIRQYVKFQEQLRSVRRAMADYFAGQQFFAFYTGDDEEDDLTLGHASGPAIAGTIDPSGTSKPQSRSRPAAKSKSKAKGNAKSH